MSAGVSLGVARTALVAGDPSYPCPSCLLGTGRIIDGAYSALFETMWTVLSSSADDGRRVRVCVKCKGTVDK